MTSRRRKNPIHRIDYSLALAFLLALAGSCSKEKNHPPAPAAEESAPAIASVTASSFEREILAADRPVVAIFSASWCKHCSELRARLARLSAAGAGKGKVEVAMVDIGAAPALKDEYAVTSVPAVHVFIAGKEVGRFVGVRDDGKLEALLAALAEPGPNRARATELLAELAAQKPGDSGCALPSGDAASADNAACLAP